MKNNKSDNEITNITLSKIEDIQNKDNIIAINNDDHSFTISPSPNVGDVKIKENKLVAYDGSEWIEVGLPNDDTNGYNEISNFIDQLSVKQLQDIYKNKDELLLQIERKLLGKI